MAKGGIADDLVASYHEDGYVLIKSMLDAEETGPLSRAAREVKAGERRFSESADEGALWLDVNNDASATQLAGR
jgi:hypothetical protein